MVPIAQHRIADQIRHELSGFGTVDALTGHVIDNGYSFSILVDVYASVAGRSLLVVHDGSTLRFFDKGTQVTVPAPVGYADVNSFTDEVADVIAAGEEIIRADEEHRDRKANLIFWAFIAAAVAIIATAFFTQNGLWMLGFVAWFFAAMHVMLYGDDRGGLGEPATSRIVYINGVSDEYERLQTQIVKFAAQHGVRFVGKTHVVIGNGEGYLMFKGTLPESSEVHTFAINSRATNVLKMTEYGFYSFRYHALRSTSTLAATS